MTQKEYLDRITTLLSRFREEVQIHNTNGYFSINNHAENVLIKVLNELYDCNLENVNYTERKNYPSIDLRDDSNEIAFQVTAISSLTKVKQTIEKFIEYDIYKNYERLYLYIITSKESSYNDKKLTEYTQGLFKFKQSQILDHSDVIKILNQKDDLNIIKRVKDLLEEQFSDYQAKALPKILTPYKKIYLSDLVGREKELKKIRQQINDSKHGVLINGMGGIGKSTLTGYYVTKYFDDYSHIVWLTIEESLTEGILKNTSLLNNLSIQIDNSKNRSANLEKVVKEVLNELRIIESDKPNLLILDSAGKELSRQFDILPGFPNWHLIVTSREVIPPFDLFSLGSLEGIYSVDLFKKYCDNYTDKQIKEIVSTVEGHPLTIEILSKSANRNHWTFEKLKNALKKDAKSGINTSHSGYDKIDRIKSYLANIFKISSLEGREKWIFQRLIVFPNVWIECSEIISRIDCNKIDWQEDITMYLENLYEHGYLKRQNGEYRMHPVLCEAISHELEIDPEYIEWYCFKVNEKMLAALSGGDPVKLYKEEKYLKALLKYDYSIPEKYKVSINLNLGLCHHLLFNLNEAKEYLEKSLKVASEIYESNHPYIARGQSKLGMLYKDLGRLSDALSLLKQALENTKAAKTYFDEKSYLIKLAKRENGLAMVLQDLKRYDESKKLLKSALIKFTDILGADSLDALTTKSNIGLCYFGLGKYEDARDVQELVLNKIKSRYGATSLRYLIQKVNLAYTLFVMKEYERLCMFLEKDLDSIVTHFGLENSEIRKLINILRCTYSIMDEYEKIKKLKSLISNVR